MINYNFNEIITPKYFDNSESYLIKKYFKKTTEHTSTYVFLMYYIYLYNNNNKNILWLRLTSKYKMISDTNLFKFARLVDMIKKPTILITSDGDLSIPNDLDKSTIELIVNNKNICLWLTTNYTNNSYNKIKPIPSGFDFHNNRDPLLNTNVYRFNYLFNIKPTNHLFKIFSDSHLRSYDRFNNPRQQIKNLFKNSDHIDLLDQHIGVKDIWKKYSEYMFGVSPHGNGLDCYRTYEMLLLGCIVIVKTSSLDILYEDLPIVIINEWDECLDKSNLQIWFDKYNKFRNREKIIEKLKWKYWFNKYNIESQLVELYKKKNEKYI